MTEIERRKSKLKHCATKKSTAVNSFFPLSHATPRHTHYCSIASSHVSPSQVEIPHLFLHSALPMMAPVPTAGMPLPISAVFIDASPKAASMISWGTFQRLGSIFSVPLSSLLRELMRSEDSQPNFFGIVSTISQD